MKLSIIVAAYNEEQYIRKCLDSLIKQSMSTGLEIIVVDDGSTDDTAKICDAYAKKYPGRLKAFHEANAGQGPARNFGISKSTGDYIGFVDADDWVSNNMFEEMYQTAVKNNSDMVVCDVNKIYDWENRQTSFHSLPKGSGSIDIKEYIEHGLDNAYSCNKIYKGKLWHEFHYQGMVYEDLDIILDMLS